MIFLGGLEEFSVTSAPACTLHSQQTQWLSDILSTMHFTDLSYPIIDFLHLFTISPPCYLRTFISYFKLQSKCCKYLFPDFTKTVVHVCFYLTHILYSSFCIFGTICGSLFVPCLTLVLSVIVCPSASIKPLLAHKSVLSLHS